jgi:hypothetical protein
MPEIKSVIGKGLRKELHDLIETSSGGGGGKELHFRSEAPEGTDLVISDRYTSDSWRIEVRNLHSVIVNALNDRDIFKFLAAYCPHRHGLEIHTDFFHSFDPELPPITAYGLTLEFEDANIPRRTKLFHGKVGYPEGDKPRIRELYIGDFFSDGYIGLRVPYRGEMVTVPSSKQFIENLHYALRNPDEKWIDFDYKPSWEK